MFNIGDRRNADQSLDRINRAWWQSLFCLCNDHRIDVKLTVTERRSLYSDVNLSILHNLKVFIYIYIYICINIYKIYIYIKYIYIYMCVCVCVCVCVCEIESVRVCSHTHTFIFIYIYIYIFVCECLYGCVCVLVENLDILSNKILLHREMPKLIFTERRFS